MVRSRREQQPFSCLAKNWRWVVNILWKVVFLHPSAIVGVRVMGGPLYLHNSNTKSLSACTACLVKGEEKVLNNIHFFHVLCLKMSNNCLQEVRGVVLSPQSILLLVLGQGRRAQFSQVHARLEKGEEWLVCLIITKQHSAAPPSSLFGNNNRGSQGEKEEGEEAENRRELGRLVGWWAGPHTGTGVVLVAPLFFLAEEAEEGESVDTELAEPEGGFLGRDVVVVALVGAVVLDLGIIALRLGRLGRPPSGVSDIMAWVGERGSDTGRCGLFPFFWTCKNSKPGFFAT